MILEFPKGFRWGTATASYQIEGGYDEDGRGMSIWDTFARTPGRVLNGDTGNVACDSYHRYKDDVALLKELGVSMYRFSVAWPRIIPDGDGEVNQAGLDYYHKLVDELVANGIEPLCTLYHWDLPQALHDKGGWKNRKTIDAFVRYAEIMFKEFGGKIKHWLTLNEPWCISFLSHHIGAHAPGEQDLQAAIDVSHHILLAHGKTVQKFRELGTAGQIGYAPNTEWFEPYSADPKDVEAARRRNAYFNNWFFDPVFKGSYPELMIQYYQSIGCSVPVKDGDMEAIHQSIDFLGINYYTGGMVRHTEQDEFLNVEYIDPGYEKTDFDWNIYPQGLYSVLTWVKDSYGDVPIIVTENGAYYDAEELNGEIHDGNRIEFMKKHMLQLHRAISAGVNLQGFMYWSLMDNFEWAFGYTKPFGLVKVNFRTLERTKKDSYYWYKSLIARNWLE